MDGNGENKRKHLEFIQDIIKRMAGNSFLLRGWSITLISAIIGFTLGLDVLVNRRERAYLILTATILTLIFWLLDAYYLHQERGYRDLYKLVAKKKESEIDFSLDIRPYLCGNNSWFSSMFSPIFVVFYIPVFIVLLGICSRLIKIDVFIR